VIYIFQVFDKHFNTHYTVSDILVQPKSLKASGGRATSER